jgi:predicted nuclease of predicted toxin-antitoxin system
MKLLIDVNLSPRWVKLLADADIEAVHWSRIGAANARGYLRCMNLPGH